MKGIGFYYNMQSVSTMRASGIEENRLLHHRTNAEPLVLVETGDFHLGFFCANKTNDSEQLLLLHRYIFTNVARRDGISPKITRTNILSSMGRPQAGDYWLSKDDHVDVPKRGSVLGKHCIGSRGYLGPFQKPI
jgi:hypothetical protein